MDIDERLCLSPGAMLQGGKYRIESILGQGGFGITYLATQVSLGRKVAIKEFFMKEHCNRNTTSSFVSVGSQGSEDIVRRYREKFMKEALLIAGVEHKHIVRIIDTFEENGTAYYVMNYHANGSLQEYVKKNGALPEAKALNYTRQLCDALRHIHANNILHLDVKPSNIMIDNDGNLVLIDFGISKHYDEVDHQTTSTPVGRSKGYAPFEQYIGGEMKKFTPATDIYSAAATLLYMLTATRPPEPDEISDMKATFPAKLLEGKGVSSATVAAIAAAMQVNKADRPQTIAAFLQLLNKPSEDFVAEVDDSDDTIHETPKETPTSPKPTPPATGVKKDPPAPKPNYLKYILGVLAVVLGIVIGVVLTNNEPAAETIAEEAVVEEEVATEEVIPELYREEQERIAEEQRKQEEATRKQREEQERIAEEQRNARKQQSGIYTANGVSFKMIAVQGGTYTMGATSEQGSDAYSNEKPAHSETVSDFMIGETEVTQELWQAVMGNNPSGFTGDLQRPVEQVSWNDCQTFIRKLNQLTGQNFRLPSEAEWEYAARGGNRSNGYKYAGSNSVGTVAWYDDNSGSTTHPVKTKQPNELGIYDMSGNVWEWCQDKWCDDYNSPRNSGSRVLRGGSWLSYAWYVRVSYRNFGTPGDGNDCRGLRLAL